MCETIIGLEHLTEDDILSWNKLVSLRRSSAPQDNDQYELLMWWKLVAKANNIPWITTENERDIMQQNQIRPLHTVQYLESKYGKVDADDSSCSSCS